MPTYRFQRLTALPDVASLRAERLASLTALPELFVEMGVRRSEVYGIEQDGRVGYLTVMDGTILTELFVVPAHQTFVDTVLVQAAEVLGLRRHGPVRLIRSCSPHVPRCPGPMRCWGCTSGDCMRSQFQRRIRCP